MTNSFAELENPDCLFVIGSNTTEAHPIAAMRLYTALKKGCKLIVVDPRKTQIAQHAHLHLPLNLGSDVALINTIMHVIYRNGWHNRSFIDERVEGFETLVEMIEQYPPERTAGITGVDPSDIVKTADWYANSESSSIVYVLGITQHGTGVDNVKSLANLAMLCGHIGRPSTGVNPLRGQNNVQGACDMGVLPNVYTGYQVVSAPEIRKKFEDAWGVQLASSPGLTLIEQIDGILEGRVKGIVIFGANPIVSYPDATRWKKPSRRLNLSWPWTSSQRPPRNWPTWYCRELLLPKPKVRPRVLNGGVQRIRRAIAPLAGKTNWEVIQELSSRVGYPMQYGSAEDIFNEMASLTPYYGGMTYARLEEKGVCWPCPTSDHPGTQFLHKDRFVQGKGLFHAIAYRAPVEQPDNDYPFWLTTGTMYSHYLTGTMTRRCQTLHRETPDAVMELNPADAKTLGVQEGERLRATTRRGSIEPRVHVTDRVHQGTVFIPLHFMENAANRLTNAALDPISKTPEYKVCAVKLEIAA